jgi:tight adherence protein C
MAWWTLTWIEEQAQDRRLAAALEPDRVFKAAPSNRALRSFPDFLDLLALGLSAGLSLDGAWRMAVEALPAGPLLDELAAFQRSVDLGKSRLDALSSLSDRLDDERIKLVIALIGQSLRRGVRLQGMLSDQAHALRQRRLTDMERRAQTAGLRLLLPIFLFIMPTVFLILFAPLAIRLSQGFSLF